MVLVAKNPFSSSHHKSYLNLRLASNRNVHLVVAEGLSIYINA